MTTSAAEDDDSSMLRSAERLNVSSEWVDVQRVRVRRRIVSKTVRLNVTVDREELVFDTDPLAPTVTGLPIPYVTPIVVVLREEVPVVSLVTQAYEQVTISVVQVAGQQQIVTTLDSEQLHLQTDDGFASP